MWTLLRSRRGYRALVKSCFIRKRNFATINTSNPVYSTDSQNPLTINDILNKVKSRDGLPTITPHVEHLVGRASRQDSVNLQDKSISDKKEMGGLDIADKTQFILQSAHPVRFIIEREIKNLDENIPRNPSYHNWLTIFGRSLGITNGKSDDEVNKFEAILTSIASASECGMFSSDIHQTVVNIPSNLEPASTRAHFNLGNKYAVLVGDYFAIRCIFFAERAKSSKAFLSITRGVEEFTSAPFASPLLDSQISYPILLSPNATVEDWVTYNWKSSGYFSGGLYAILTLMAESSSQNVNEMGNWKHEVMGEKMKKFVPNISVLLKAINEIQDLQRGDNLMCSPFTLTSLPAVLYQRKVPGIFEFLRGRGYDFNMDDLRQLREEIRTSAALTEAKDILRYFAKEARESYSTIAVDPFYLNIFHELVDALVCDCTSSSVSTKSNNIDSILALDQSMTKKATQL